MRRRIASALSALLLLLPCAAGAAELPCTQEHLVALRERVARLTTGLKIALYRADMALMTEKSQELEALLGPRGSCPGTMKPLLCDAACYLQRGGVHHFRATGIPLLSSRGSSSPGGPMTGRGQLLEEARQGLSLVEEGLDVLPRQQGPMVAGEPQPKMAFNRYLRSMAQLNALKAKLLLASGDLWYQEASRSRQASLSFLVARTSGAATTGSGQPGSEHYQAATYYDQAFWILLEARGNVPEDEMFAAERSALAALEKDVQARLQSVRKGYLFLDIDPEDFTFKSLGELGAQLRAQKGALERQEGEVAELLEAWAKKFRESKDRQFDVQNMKHARAIDVEVYKIAQMEEEAGALKAAVEHKLRALESADTRLELEQQIRALEADLKRETRQLEGQIRLVQQQEEEDLLSLEKENVRDRLDDIRFNIDMTVSDFNFEMQKESIRLQIEELDGRARAGEAEIGVLFNAREQVQQNIALSRRRIEAAEIMIARYRQEQDTVFKSARAPIVHEICGIEAELAFHGAPAGGYSDPGSGVSCSAAAGGPGDAKTLGQQICAQRAALSDKTVEELKKIKGCLDGSGSCEGSEGLKKVVEKTFEQNKAMFAQQEKHWQATQAKLDEHVAKLRSALQELTVLAGLKTAADVLASALAASEAIPDVTTGVTGPFPTVLTSTTQSVKAAARAIAAAARAAFEGAVQILELKQEFEARLHEAAMQIADAEHRLAEAKGQNLLEQYARDRALAEISVQLAQLGKEQAEADLQKKLQQLECDLDQARLGATVAKLQAQRAGLVAQLAAKSDEAALVRFSIEEQENLRGQSEAEIARYEIEIRGLELQVQKVEQERRNLAAMRGSLERQLGKVDTYQGRIRELKGKFDATRAVLADIQEKFASNVLRFSKEQQAFALAAIKDAEGVVFEQIAAIRRRIELKDAEKLLGDELAAIDRRLRDAVKASRDKILALAASAPESAVDKLFWDFEDLSAELVRGAPEMLDHKRRLLESVNFVYNLYRNRYDMLRQFSATALPIPNASTIIRTAGDLEDALRYCGTLDAGELCHPGSLTWDKMTITGLNAEFDIERNSGLLSTLVERRRARFEISPRAASRENSAKLGSFVLWDERTMSDTEQMLLVHILAQIRSNDCGRQQLTVRHLGFGTLFSPLSRDSGAIVPSLVVKRPVSALLPALVESERPRMEEEFGKLRGGSYTVETFERKLHEGEEVYPFVGYPLIGSYELVADDNLRQCLHDVKGLTLAFLFMRPQPPED